MGRRCPRLLSCYCWPLCACSSAVWPQRTLPAPGIPWGWLHRPLGFLGKDLREERSQGQTDVYLGGSVEPRSCGELQKEQSLVRQCLARDRHPGPKTLRLRSGIARGRGPRLPRPKEAAWSSLPMAAAFSCVSLSRSLPYSFTHCCSVSSGLWPWGYQLGRAGGSSFTHRRPCPPGLRTLTFLVQRVTDAPRLMSSSATSKWPQLRASCRGVMPSQPWPPGSSTAAPWSSKKRTMSVDRCVSWLPGPLSGGTHSLSPSQARTPIPCSPRCP